MERCEEAAGMIAQEAFQATCAIVTRLRKQIPKGNSRNRSIYEMASGGAGEVPPPSEEEN